MDQLTIDLGAHRRFNDRILHISQHPGRFAEFDTPVASMSPLTMPWSTRFDTLTDPSIPPRSPMERLAPASNWPLTLPLI